MMTKVVARHFQSGVQGTDDELGKPSADGQRIRGFEGPMHDATRIKRKFDEYECNFVVAVCRTDPPRGQRQKTRAKADADHLTDCRFGQAPISLAWLRRSSGRMAGDPQRARFLAAWDILSLTSRPGLSVERSPDGRAGLVGWRTNLCRRGNGRLTRNPRLHAEARAAPRRPRFVLDG